MTTDTSDNRATETAVRRTNLGRQSGSFIGRSREIGSLHRAFEEGARLVSLVGPAGVGKTRLASEFGRALIDMGVFVEVWFCDISEARTASDLLTSIATVVRLPRIHQDTSEMVARLTHLLDPRGDVLLILDNLEQVIDDARPVVLECLGRLQTVRCLTTSREPLRLADEVRLNLAPLNLAEAVELFHSRAKAVQSNFQPPAGQNGTVAELVERLDRFPLAVELAATRSNILSPSQILDRVGHRRRLLEDKRTDRPLRHQSLENALEWSWELLDPWERSALTQCTVFRGGFSLDAAEAIIDLRDYPEAPWTVDVLSALFNRSLITTVTSAESSEARYALFESVRDFGSRRLREADRQALEQRHARFYLHGAERNNDALDGSDESSAVAWFRRERANLTAAYHFLASLDPRRFGRFVLAVERFLSGRFSIQMLLELFDPAVEALEGAGDDEVLARVITARAFALIERGRVDQATSDVERAQAIGQKVRDTRTQLKVALMTGTYLRAKKNWREARERLQLARRLAKDLLNPTYEGKAILYLGLVESARADADPTSLDESIAAAEELYQQALRIFQKAESSRWQAAILNSIGNLHLRLGRRAEQRYYHELALEHAEAAEHRTIRAAILQGLGELNIAEMRYRDAERQLSIALRIQREAGQHHIEAETLRLLGLLDADRGDWTGAMAHLLEASDVARSLTDLSLQCQIQLWLGLTHLGANRSPEAVERFDKARDLAEKLGDESQVNAAVAAEAAALALLGASDSAIETWEQVDPHRTVSYRLGGEGVMSRLQAIVDVCCDADRDSSIRAQELVAEVKSSPARATPAVRVLSEVVERALSEMLETDRQADSLASGVGSTGRLVIGSDFGWFEAPGGSKVDLRRRWILKVLVEQLVAQWRESPGEPLGVDVIIETLWPGQIFIGESGATRVYTAIRTLRKLGLGDMLLTKKGGYLLDPAVDITLRQESSLHPRK